ncbi:EIF3A [Lepeophtheirus salmonis]|uniref:Eukaryotic translation initiation factor 3 subunit A n=1 Tax=Lepeophtheirus salmonis TaxID=72036 RepID=A0A7R8CTR0_LEPSM|nr:EIF3A [Lepeophtheirus salmonis]CAF2891280.1 EIF3A [Lepeophtheirus salmonis]
MSRYYQRPENAISKAEEFIKVGKDTRALDTLYDVIKSKKRNHNTFPEKLLEQIMFKYLDLCVELKKSHVAKEGLYQYRNMCQSTNVASLASVVQFYLTTTPEMIMLSAVSGEDAQDRSDRTILMPWVKFLWESYCQCLELLRTNVRVERLYHDIAQQAFRFCLKYQRKTEFRKLCEKLRTHLELTIKQTTSPMSINLHNPDTQQLNLETRLIQLDAAIQLELWQEAYKAIEDIHGLMVLSKKIYQPKTMSNYYQKVALVYWKSGCHLFHAAAVFKHFQLNRDMKKNISSEELSKMASRVLVSILAIPQPSQHPEFDKFIEMDRTPQEKMARLALQLGLQQPPTRTSLIKDVYRFGILQFATPEIQNFAEDMSSLRQYIPSLKQVTLVRLLRQVSQSYQSICFNRLLEIAPFTDAFSLERMIVDCVRHNDMQIRIDHRTRTIHFGTDLVESHSHDVADGPQIQDMPSEQIHKFKLENNALRLKIVESYHQSKQREHERILQRRKTIEDRKEYLEKRAQDIAAEEDAKRELILREQQELEEKRLESERIEREQRKQKVEQIAQTEIGKKVLDKLDENEIAELDADQIMKRQVIELEKEKRELISRLNISRKIKSRIKYSGARREEDRIAQAKSEREVALATQKRLSRIKDDKNIYLSQLLKERKSEFEKKLKEFNVLMEKEKVRRLAERKELRKSERREKWIKEKKEEEQRLRDEQLKREREEKQRLEEERALEEEKAWQKKNAELEVIEAKRRAREKEIKEEQEREGSMGHFPDRREDIYRSAASPSRENRSLVSKNWRDDIGSKKSDIKRSGDGFRRDDRDSRFRRDDRDSGFRRDDRDSGFRRDDRDSGFRRDDRDSGFRRDDRDSGFRRDDRDGGSRRNERDDGFKRNDRDSGFKRNDRDSGFRKEDRDGGVRRDEQRRPYNKSGTGMDDMNWRSKVSDDKKDKPIRSEGGDRYKAPIKKVINNDNSRASGDNSREGNDSKDDDTLKRKCGGRFLIKGTEHGNGRIYVEMGVKNTGNCDSTTMEGITLVPKNQEVSHRIQRTGEWEITTMRSGEIALTQGKSRNPNSMETEISFKRKGILQINKFRPFQCHLRDEIRSRGGGNRYSGDGKDEWDVDITIVYLPRPRNRKLIQNMILIWDIEISVLICLGI